MSRVEFETVIDNGTIALPPQYRGRFRGRVRVILITEEYQGEEDLIAALLEHPLNIPDFQPLSREEIYNE